MQKSSLVLFLSLIVVNLYGQDTLTQARVIELAKQNNLNIRELELEVEIARGEYYQVNNFFPSFPKVDIDYETDKFTSDNGSYALGLGLTQEIEIGGQFSTRKKLADIRLQKARILYNRSLFEYENRLRRVLLEVNTAALKLELTKEIMRINNALLNFSQQRLMAGDISQLDYNMILIENNLYAAELKQQETTLRNTINNLSIYLPSETLRITYIAPDTNIQIYSITLEQLRTNALQNRADLRLFEFDIREADAEISLAYGENIPNLELKFGYHKERSVILGDDIKGTHSISLIDDRGTSLSIGVGFSLPLPFSGLYNLNQGDIQIAKIRKQIALNKRELNRRALNKELTNAYNKYVSSLETIQSLIVNDQIIENTIDLLQRGYEKGEISIIDYFSELSRLYELRQKYIETLETYVSSVLELELITQTKLTK